MEFIRLDLSLPSGGVGSAEVTTRRQAAGDVLQALVSSGLGAETTEIVGTWISTGLQEYRSNPAQNWKAKNSAVYLLTAIASRGSTSMVRETSHLSLIILMLVQTAWRDCYEPARGRDQFFFRARIPGPTSPCRQCTPDPANRCHPIPAYVP